MKNVINDYILKARMSGNVPFFEAEDAIQILNDCKRHNIRIFGIDAIKMTDNYTQPYSDHSVDYSNKTDVWDEAIKFIEERKNLGLLFEIVI